MAGCPEVKWLESERIVVIPDVEIPGGARWHSVPVEDLRDTYLVGLRALIDRGVINGPAKVD
jgi:hypothetical protein